MADAAGPSVVYRVLILVVPGVCWCRCSLEELREGEWVEHEATRTMKWALDTWYELWEKVRKEERPNCGPTPEEEDHRPSGSAELLSVDQEPEGTKGD